jgi:chaperone required for assembly of F1-ATPase
MKRVWARAAFVPMDGAFAVQLDGKPVKTPSGKALAVPFQALAAAIAREWDQAPDRFTPDDLPLMQLAVTALERVPANRVELVSQLAWFGLTDLLCYRAAEPPALVSLQHDAWQPWLDWADSALGIPLVFTTGLLPVAQPAGTRLAFETLLASLPDYALAGLGVIAPALGSLVLGLAVLHGALQPEAACELSQLDESWQEQNWGTDPDAANRRQKVSMDVATSAAFIELCR